MVKSLNLKAFTLLEVIVVLGVFFALGFLALPVAIREIQTGRIDAFIKDLNSRLLLCSQDAFSGKYDKSCGLALYSDRYIIFVGESLALAEDSIEVQNNEQVTINNITFTGGGNEVVFNNGQIEPSVTGYFDVGDSTNLYRFTINEQGLISFSKL